MSDILVRPRYWWMHLCVMAMLGAAVVTDIAWLQFGGPRENWGDIKFWILYELPPSKALLVFSAWWGTAVALLACGRVRVARGSARVCAACGYEVGGPAIAACPECASKDILWTVRSTQNRALKGYAAMFAGPAVVLWVVAIDDLATVKWSEGLDYGQHQFFCLGACITSWAGAMMFTLLTAWALGLGAGASVTGRRNAAISSI